MNYRKHTP